MLGNLRLVTVGFLQNHLEPSQQTCSKDRLLTPDCGEGKYGADCRIPSKKNGKRVLKRPNFLMVWGKCFFKANVREGL